MTKKIVLYVILSAMLISGCNQAGGNPFNERTEENRVQKEDTMNGPEEKPTASESGDISDSSQTEEESLKDTYIPIGEDFDNYYSGGIGGYAEEMETQYDRMISDEETGTEETTAGGSRGSEVKNELVISDIFIPEDECLKHTPFMSGSVECVLQDNPNLERVKSEERANGYFNYWKGDGIEYVTYGEEQNICGIIISDHYSLDCGLKIGMEEADLQKNFPVMDRYEKENLLRERGQIIFSGNMMCDKLGPLQTTDYDYAYACVCGASEEEVEEYQINVTTGYSVTAFIKDGKVCKIVLDLPMAG